MNFFKEVTLKKLSIKKELIKHTKCNKKKKMTYSLNLCSFDKVDDKKIIR